MARACSEDALVIDPESPVLLIDLSYVVFHRYYALLCWYKKSETTMDMEDMVARFSRLFKTNFLKLCTQCKIHPKHAVFVGDCPRAHIWRMRLLETYKSNRDNRPRIPTEIFECVYSTILSSLQRDHGARYVMIEEAEADDIIGWIHRQLPNTSKTIITNDNDYLQLADDKTLLLNLQRKNIAERGTGDAREDLTRKILAGDPSDNIAGVVSVKRAATLAAMPYEEMLHILEQEAKLEVYRANERLIDMRMIPSDVEAAIGVKVKIHTHASPEPP
jgi:5'-3' exonuclease